MGTVGRVETAGVVEEAQKDEREEDKGWKAAGTKTEKKRKRKRERRDTKSKGGG